MKRMFIVALLSSSLVGFAYAGPANSIELKTGTSKSKEGVEIGIKNSIIKNKSEVRGSKITNIGRNQTNVINSIKIRKNVGMSNSKVENRGKMEGSQVTNVGRNQVNVIGGIDIGGD
jgi:hypothetical protein